MTKVFKRTYVKNGKIIDQEITDDLYLVIFKQANGNKISVRADTDGITITVDNILVIEPAAANMIYVTERKI